MTEHKEQPTPTKNDTTPIWDLVIEDIHARDDLGEKRYGTRLQAHNGRDPLRDAYEESLDLVVYLRQEMEERRDLNNKLVELRYRIAELEGEVEELEDEEKIPHSVRVDELERRNLVLERIKALREEVKFLPSHTDRSRALIEFNSLIDEEILFSRGSKI